MILTSLESEVINLKENKISLWNNQTIINQNQRLEQEFNIQRNEIKHPNR